MIILNNNGRHQKLRNHSVRAASWASPKCSLARPSDPKWRPKLTIGTPRSRPRPSHDGPRVTLCLSFQISFQFWLTHRRFWEPQGSMGSILGAQASISEVLPITFRDPRTSQYSIKVSWCSVKAPWCYVNVLCFPSRLLCSIPEIVLIGIYEITWLFQSRLASWYSMGLAGIP